MVTRLITSRPPPQPSEQRLDDTDTARADWEGFAASSVLDSGPGRPERRRTPRGVAGFEPHRAQLVSRTLESYEEMPGQTLFAHQAARLFGISRTTCQLLLDDLVKEHRLTRDPSGQYAR